MNLSRSVWRRRHSGARYLQDRVLIQHSWRYNILSVFQGDRVQAKEQVIEFVFQIADDLHSAASHIDDRSCGNHAKSDARASFSRRGIY